MSKRKPNLSDEEREAYRRHRLMFDFDRAQRARKIIRGAHRRAHPHAKVSPRDGILYCGNPITHGEIQLYLDERGHEYHEHKHCKSWACPQCAPRLANDRAAEIAAALLAANKRGCSMLFVTFTVPHRKSHSTSFVIDRLNRCYNRFLQLRAIRRVKKDFGFIGAIRCLDHTLGPSGTHAHLHTIWFFDAPTKTSEEWLGFYQRIAAQFLKSYDGVVFRETGQHINQHHGFNVERIDLGKDGEDNATQVARYAAKAISVYCSDGDKDKGSHTVFDLLDGRSTEQDREMFLDFYKGQKRRRHVLFSPGLRSRLGISRETETSHASVAVAGISYEHAYRLKDESMRQQFETLARDSIDKALDWLQEETEKQQREFLGAKTRRENPFFGTLPQKPRDYELNFCGIARYERVCSPPGENEGTPPHYPEPNDIKKRHPSLLSDTFASRAESPLNRITRWIYRRRHPSGLGIALMQAERFRRKSSLLCWLRARRVDDEPPIDVFFPRPGSILGDCWSDDDDFGF